MKKALFIILLFMAPVFVSAMQAPKDFWFIDILTGNTNFLKDSEGKIVFVNLFATWCPPCREELPVLDRLAREYPDNVAVIGIALDEVPPAELKQYLLDRGIAFPVMTPQTAHGKWWQDPDFIPATYVLGKDFQVIEVFNGAKSYDTFAQYAQGVIPKKAAIKITPLDSSLLHAAKFGDIKELKNFIAQGANIHVADDSSNRVLNNAAAYGHTEIVKYLLELGADKESAGLDGATPLIEACKYGKVDTVKVLLGAGANIHAVDTYGASALHWAAMGGYTAVMELLIASGAKIDAEDAYYRTPLHYAAYSGMTPAAELLVKKGASLSAKDSGGNSPLFYAKELERDTVVEYLLSIGAE
ncbi:MAG: hypothetical protein A2Y33_12370 [Spirochaetes bacterium GWF1_51_8]|nr:MAG: hypothetical protein A2Y33_12370 [Spirochaetes bacterium GWF1_51_8]